MGAPPPNRPPRSPVTSARARALVALGLGLGVALLVGLVRRTALGERLELPLVDVRTRLCAGARGPDPRIVICQVREGDVDAVRTATGESWPWPLSLNAAIVEVLRAAGAAGIVVDVYHFDQGAGTDDHRLRFGPDTPVGQRIDGEASEAEEYGRGIREFGRAVVAFEASDRPTYDLPARRDVGLARLGADALAPPAGARAHVGANWPVRRVAAGATVLAFANVAPDLDGVSRRMPVVATIGGHPAMSLALAGAALLSSKPPELRAGRLVVDGVDRPIDRDGTFHVDFRRDGPGAYARVSPSTILRWAQDRDADAAKRLPDAAVAALAGKLVVFGVNLAGLEDLVPTSIGANFEGPELQATTIDNLLNGGGRVRAAGSADLGLLGLAAIAAALVAGFGKGKVRPFAGLAAILAAVAGLAWLAFRAGTILDVGAPLAGAVLAAGATLAWRAGTEGRYNRWLERTTGRFLSPGVLEAIKSDPSLLELGGRAREVTILFSDVAGFTSLSERLAPPDVVTLLNRYLTRHCEAVFAEDGTVDKFIGDAVMAFWGDPIPQADHALRACRAALAVQRDLPGLEPVWRGMGLSRFPVRIGIHSGPVVVGSMGSDHRSDYTCMGDTVNFASRLEAANKVFGTKILIGEETARRAGDAVLVKPIGALRVVGKSATVPVHELVATSADASPDLRAHVEAYRKAHAAARTGDPVAARAALDEAERLRPGDGATAWLAGVVAGLDAGTEPSPWNGEVTLSSK